jgi:hypothetical protein
VSWSRLVAAIAWLGSLPPELATRLDLTELVLPEGAVADVRAEVEHALGAHVMTYQTGRPATGRLQLCQTLEPAPLTGHQITLLRTAESHLDRIVLCAYARPLRLRPAARRKLRLGDMGSAGFQ